MEIDHTDQIVDQDAPAAEERKSSPTNPITDLHPTPDSKHESADEDTPEARLAKREAEIQKGAQKRIDKITRAKYEAEARTKMLEERLAALETRQQPAPVAKTLDNAEPKLENFDNFDEYVRAKAEYIAERKINKTLSEREERQRTEYEAAARQKTADSWAKRLTAATAELPDFEDVVASSDVPMTNAMRDAIMESDVGPRLAYYLAQNPDDATAIANMSPIGAIRAIGRIEERLTAQKPPVVKAAPAPIKPVTGRATVSKDPGKMSDEEYAKWRKSAA